MSEVNGGILQAPRVITPKRYFAHLNEALAATRLERPIVRSVARSQFSHADSVYVDSNNDLGTVLTLSPTPRAQTLNKSHSARSLSRTPTYRAYTQAPGVGGTGCDKSPENVASATMSILDLVETGRDHSALLDLQVDGSLLGNLAQHSSAPMNVESGRDHPALLDLQVDGPGLVLGNLAQHSSAPVKEEQHCITLREEWEDLARSAWAEHGERHLEDDFAPRRAGRSLFDQLGLGCFFLRPQTRSRVKMHESKAWHMIRPKMRPTPERPACVPQLNLDKVLLCARSAHNILASEQPPQSPKSEMPVS